MNTTLKMIGLIIATATINCAYATVYHTDGTITAQAADGSYSVLHSSGSTWNGVPANEVTPQQVQNFEATRGKALTATNQARTQQQVAALASAQALNATHLDSNSAVTSGERAQAMQNAIMQHREVIAHQTRYAGMNNQPMINVSVASVRPQTPVSVTVNGVTTQTTAGQLAHVSPQIQVAVPHNSAFQTNPGKGSSNSKSTSHSAGSAGNGGNNAANSASAHGLGGGNHIGGGSAESGSRGVGNW